ncbi:MAG: hypothetical protein AAF806_17270 [Bacteroidota bacterium]
MKYTFILIFFFSFLLSHTQSMQWVSLGEKGNCLDLSDKEQDIYCVGLEYTPAISGILSSYTTGFLINCTDGDAPIILNQSCLLQDHSQVLDGCDKIGKILLNASANSGGVKQSKLEKGVAIVLHQVCFEISQSDKIEIQKDDITNLTTAIILDENSKLLSEFPAYETHKIEQEGIRLE